MARIDLVMEHAKELSGRADWRPVVFEALPAKKPLFYKLSSEDDFAVSIPFDVHEKWEVAWSLRTGKCRKCVGEGRTANGWNVNTGTRFVVCKACGGTGKAAEKNG